MATKLRIQQLCAERGTLYNGNPVTSGYALGKLCKIRGLSTWYRLWNGTSVQIGLDMIDLLCDGLQCEPGDLFERVETPKVSRGKSKAIPAKKKRAAKANKAKKTAARKLAESLIKLHYSDGFAA